MKRSHINVIFAATGSVIREAIGRYAVVEEDTVPSQLLVSGNAKWLG